MYLLYFASCEGLVSQKVPRGKKLDSHFCLDQPLAYAEPLVARTAAATEESSQSIQVPSSAHPGTTYAIRAIPHSDIYIYIYIRRERERERERARERAFTLDV